jgi:hypothetical protein
MNLDRTKSDGDRVNRWKGEHLKYPKIGTAVEAFIKVASVTSTCTKINVGSSRRGAE